MRPRGTARAIAFSILLDVESKAAYASDLLYSRLAGETDAREAALATELVMGTLRWQRALDFLIERYIERSASRLDGEVLVALRMGIYQLRHLKRIPARAAVNESVELIRRARKSSAAALLNAALRHASMETDEPVAALLPPDLSPRDRLSFEHSHPPWMVERWLLKFGREKTTELLEWNNRAPVQAVSILEPARRNEIIQSLKESGIEIEAGRLLRDAILIRKGTVTRTAPLQNGWIALQDEASQMIPLLLGVNPDDSVLDLCAAPGGKTLSLARQAGANTLVVACDIHESRLRAMRERLQAAGVANVSVMALDGTRVLPFARKFDRILVDAPCSGTGTLARNPEIRWRLPPEDLPAFHERQVALLTSALSCLTPDGRLVYSTCSLETEENEAVVDEALAQSPGFCAEPPQIPHGALVQGVYAEDLAERNSFRTFPPQHHADGFFAVTIRKK